MEIFLWVGIIFCVSQSAMFSGLNLAFFSVSKGCKQKKNRD